MPPRFFFAIFDFAADEIDPEFGFSVRLILRFLRLFLICIEEEPVRYEGDVRLVPIFVELFLAVLIFCIIQITFPIGLERKRRGTQMFIPFQNGFFHCR